MQVIEVMTSGDEDEEDEGLGAEERTGLVETVIDVCRLGWQGWWWSCGGDDDGEWDHDYFDHINFKNQIVGIIVSTVIKMIAGPDFALQNLPKLIIGLKHSSKTYIIETL